MKAHLETFSKIGGVVAVSFEWLALLIYYIQYPSYWGGSYPISYYATLPGTRIAFSVCYLVAAICFWLFTRHHLKKQLRAPIKTFSFSMLCFAGTALFPYDPTSVLSSSVHLTLAALTFSSFILGIFFMAQSSDAIIRKVSMAAALLSGILLFLLVLVPKNSSYIFGLETGSWFVCQLWILWISYRLYNR